MTSQPTFGLFKQVSLLLPIPSLGMSAVWTTMMFSDVVTVSIFRYLPSVSQGDPYANLEKTGKAPKTSGKQFQTSGPKKGKTPDVYFNPAVTTSVYVGSKYTTLAEQDRRCESVPT